MCACGRQLRWRENVPILGWLVYKGTARCCLAKIPVRYLWAEIFLTLAWSVAGMLSGGERVWALILAVTAAGATLGVTWQRQALGDTAP